MSLQDHEWNTTQCIRCHSCKSNPVQKSKQFSPLCPSIDYGQFHAYSASGKIITAMALDKGRASYTPAVIDSITACTLCGACDTACQSYMADIVDPLNTIYALRAKMFEDGQVPAGQRTLLENIESDGNMYGRPRADRTLWAKDLDIADATSEKVDVLLHVGCANAFDEAQWPGLAGVAALLAKSGVSFGTLGAQEVHAGALPFELGNHALARQCAEETIRLVSASGAALLITCDAESLAAFRNFYPRMGLSLHPVRVMHITEYLEELAQAGKWSTSTGKDEVVTYHDPCRLGRLSEPFVPWQGERTTVMNGLRIHVPPRPKRFGLGGVYDAPRQLLQSVPGTRLVEMERKREFSYCCGAGGGGKEANPDFAEQAALHRLDEARSTGATTLVSSCGTCTRHLDAVARKNGIDITVTDLVGYLTKA